MKNTYFLMRHGQSTGNVKHIIVSDPKNGVPHYGLSAFGKQQALDSIRSNKDLDKHTIIYSSDFKRARETAEIVRDHIKAKPIILTKALRERNFGKFEKKDYTNFYLKVWECDFTGKPFKGIESVYSIANRFRELLDDLEKKHKGKKILLVTHGDVASVGLTVFNNKDPKYHNKIYSSLKTAEIKKVNK
ncbi:MAG TPA: histidine phosphatase family protein [archaeon]|nr:histidine phosphatase family protein [archaeon]HPV66115.1 histidine phosphatase family protein [archaeon]